MSRSSRIPIVLCIDVEPDEHKPHRSDGPSWSGFVASHAYLQSMRERLSIATGAPVRYNWFFRMDPQIERVYGSLSYGVEAHREIVEELAVQGDQFGLHCHSYRWDPARSIWIEDMADQRWIDHCLDVGFQAFRDSFAAPCEVFRYGYYWMSTATMNRLEALGARYDLSVEPGLTAVLRKPDTSADWVSLGRVPRHPYQPAREDFRRVSHGETRTITEIPLTSGALKLGFDFGRHLKRMKVNGFRYRLQSAPLSMWRTYPPGNEFGTMMAKALSRQRQPYLAFALRTSFAVRHTFANVTQAFEGILRHPACERFKFVTPVEALTILTP
jgi:hypothetical protein